MKYPVFTLKDKKVGYISPSIAQNISAAIREFAFNVNKPDHIMNFKPEDFELYKIGEFDSETGVIIAKEKEFLVSGDNVIDKEDKE